MPAPLTDQDFRPIDMEQAALGRLLFYDKILSGNDNIACGTCHHHDLAGADGLSLGIGEGGQGIGAKRNPGEGDQRIGERIPRNAPALWNLGHVEISKLFHDGRVELSDSYSTGFNSPADATLPEGLTNIVAVQALFPMTSGAEMAGGSGDSTVGAMAAKGAAEVWPVITAKVQAVPEYTEMFEAVYDNVNAPEDITIVEIVEAIAAFIMSEWRNHDSPFDQYLAGDKTALKENEIRGMEVFFDKGNCASCHSGPLLSDQDFHALALPQFGPGRPVGDDPTPRDLGRMEETGNEADLFRFRTPPLRNVELTAPYGHNGSYTTLEGIVRHHLDPAKALAAWRAEYALLPKAPWIEDKDFALLGDAEEAARLTQAVDIASVSLSDQEMADLLDFLHCLTGETAKTRPMGRPDKVPSGLPVD